MWDVLAIQTEDLGVSGGVPADAEADKKHRTVDPCNEKTGI